MNTRWLSAVAGLVAVAALAGTAFANAPMKVTVKTVTPVKTIPLRDLQYVNLPPIMRRIIGDARFSQRQINQLYNKLIQEGYLQRASGQFAIHNPWKKPALSQAPRVQDRAIQTKLYGPQPNSITAGQAFPGIGASNTPPDSVGCEPPDTDMAVGANDVVELVNLCEGSGTGYFKAWNKLTGAVIQNTTSLSGMWGANSGCDQGGGDNMVLYDQLANRWIMSQLNNLDDGICVAISETGDPTGAYYLYNFPIVASGSLSDYPKVAVWPDAYYVSTNDFEDFSYFEHVDFTALDRSAMLTGSAATMIIINGQDNGLDYSVLPADLDGMTPPPANDPGIFVNFGSPYESGTPYALNFWRMHVDFANPDSSTLSGPVSLAVDAFNDGICGGGLGGGCIPQPSGAEGLEALGDRLMFRLAYRNFGDHQAMVVNHTVGTGNPPSSPPAGIRWYEVDAPAGATASSGFTIAQQGTYLPNDGNSRWMASIAMDHVGNIALGYSISSTSMYPSAAFTGQNVGGPSGVMDAGETVFLTGSGVQEGNDDRWGDYSAMMPDPTDDCTFWTSQEYISQTGGQWSTALGSFKFDNCSIGPTGIVEGTVTDASSGDPISGATVTFTPGGSVATTNGSGQYSITLAPGDYTATASALGYEPQSASVTVSNGGTTEQDFALQSASGATLSGIVYDTGHHYPLFAEVVIDAGSQQVADVLTGANGKYSVSLPTGTTYTMTATPYLSGYTPGTATVTLSGDTQQQFGLSPDASCSAPGYSSANGSCEAIPGGLVMGKAFDANTKQVLSGVTVTDESGNTTTTGPVNGQVGFVMFEPTGSHTLTFASSQYQDATKDVSVSNGAVVPVWVGLNAGQLGVRPTSQTLNVPVGTQQSFALQIGNTGLAPVDWTLTSINSPPSRPQRKGKGVNVPLHKIQGHFSPASLMTLAKEGRAANAVRPSGPVLSPAQGSSAWAAVADYPIPVLDNCAAAAPSGTVYSVGGDSDVAVTAAGYAYDPSSNSWSSIASLPEGLEKPACAFIGGKLYVTAGWDSSGNNNSTLYIYDPSSDSWSTGASMTVSVGGAPGDAVVNGDFYVIGGCGNSSSCPGTTGVEVYDSSSNSWSTAADYPEGISWTGCGGTQGEVYCGGGVNAAGTGDTTDAYAYDPSSNSWTQIASLAYDNWGMAAIATADGHLLFSLGVTEGFDLLTNQGQSYDVAGNSWSMLPNNLVTTYRAAGACGFYTIGGMDSGGTFTGIQNVQVLSGYNVCGVSPSVPWLSFNPAMGTLAGHSHTTSMVTVDGTGQTSGTSDTVQIVLGGNTPYGSITIPLTVNWTPAP